MPGDRTALEAMFARCSLQTRYRRFHAPVAAIPARYLAAALAGRPDHYALVAAAPSGEVVALASACATEPGTVEVGILVEDASQGRGLGGFLLRLLVEHARRRGVRVITAVILREQPWILRLLRPYGDCETTSVREATFATVRLSP
jgi:L-amino acid N-acyltransferase YncA